MTKIIRSWKTAIMFYWVIIFIVMTLGMRFGAEIPLDLALKWTFLSSIGYWIWSPDVDSVVWTPTAKFYVSLLVVVTFHMGHVIRGSR